MLNGTIGIESILARMEFVGLQEITDGVLVNVGVIDEIYFSGLVND